MNRQDGRPQFEPKRNNLSSYAHCQLRLEQAKLAIAWGVGSRNGWKTQVLFNFNEFGPWAMQEVRLIVESMTFATTLVSLTLLIRQAAGGILKKKNC
jgi:hypothetical protein